MAADISTIAVWRTYLRRAAAVLLAGIPLAILPGAENRFVFGRLVVAAFAALLLLAIPGAGRLPRWMWLSIGAATLVTGIAGVFGADVSTAWWGRGQVYDGAPFLVLCLIVAMGAARHLGPHGEPGDRELFLNAMAVVALVVALLAIVEATGLRPLSTDASRPGSFLGNASDEGSFALLYGGVLLVAAMNRRRPLLIAGGVATGVTVLLSGSRGAWIGLLVLLGVAALLAGRRAPVVSAFAGLVAVVAVFLDPVTRGRLLGGGLAHQTASGRVMLWQESLSLWTHHPILGVGPSQFENAIVGRHTLAWQQRVGPQNPPATPHNLVLQLLLAGGPVLLAVLAYVAWRVYRCARKQSSWGTSVVVALAAYLTALMFTFPTPAVMLPAVVLVASVTSVPVAATAAWQQVVEWGFATLAAGLAVVFVLASASEIEIKAGMTHSRTNHRLVRRPRSRRRTTCAGGTRTSTGRSSTRSSRPVRAPRRKRGNGTVGSVRPLTTYR
ncbi:O-antigen ligase family protein [Flexivirga alba]|uniref:O-antigen ligase family protein n=1 Tax=Flexivirga alba TaxID=702742 RepID=A0ABW2ADT6_9MICO